MTLCVATLVYLVAFVPLLDGHSHPVGSDYSYFLPRLLGDHYWFRLNGLFEVPWFTPGFCGGIPDWANPQDAPYSLTQWLLWFVDPVRAVQITFAVFAVLGASGTWVLLRKGFETSSSAALLGSVLFLYNGFYLSRLVVGHLPFHPFMLTPWVGWLLIRSRRSRWELAQDAIVGGLLLTIMIQSGMVTILLPVGVVWLTIGLIHGLRHPDPARFWARLAGVIAVGGLLSASKLAAAAAFASSFGRDFYALSGFKSLGATLLATFRVLFLRPMPIDEQGYLPIPVRLPVHEGDYNISLVPLAIIAVAAIIGRRTDVAPSRGGRLRLIAIGLLLLLPIALNTFSPGWMQLLKHVPVIRQSSTLLRWFLLYIPVLAVVAALAVDRLPARPWFVAGGVALAIGWSLSTNHSAYLDKSYLPTWIVQGWEAQKEGQPIPVIEKMELKLINGRPQPFVGGDDVLTAGASQVACFEPLFGYFQEALPWRHLHEGPALDASDGHLNVLNPACELFPAANDCKPGDRFREDQQAEAEAFLSWSPFPFQRSAAQRVADLVSLIMLVSLPVVLLFVVRKSRAA